MNILTRSPKSFHFIDATQWLLSHAVTIKYDTTFLYYVCENNAKLKAMNENHIAQIQSSKADEDWMQLLQELIFLLFSSHVVFHSNGTTF